MPKNLRSLLLVFITLMFGVFVSPVGAQTLTIDDFSNEGVDWLKSALKCDQSLEKRYCEAMDGFKQGGPVTFTNKNVAGSSLYVEVSGHVEEAGYVVLLQGGKVTYAKVSPENEQEKKQVIAYLNKLHAGNPLTSDDPIVAYVQTLSSMAKYTPQTIGKSSVYYVSNYIFMRQSGHKIFVIETPEGDPLAAVKGDFHASAIKMALGGFKAYYIGVFEIP